MSSAFRILLVLAAVSLAASPAASPMPPAIAAPLPPTDLFAFPGSNLSPASAASAGLALADRWLGDEPFDHAAGALRSVVSGSPIMLRTSRQDLRADNNDYTDTAAFFDAAGGYTAWAPRDRHWGVALYASQPVLRREETHFVHGEAGAPTPPFTIAAQTESREARVGLALAWRLRGLELGVAPEVTTRSDRFVRDEQSAGPSAGITSWDYSGSGVGAVVSARGTLPASILGHVRMGGSVRFLSELAMDGSATLVPGNNPEFSDISRESAWEGGVSIEASPSPVYRVIVGAGGRTATSWRNIAAANGASSQYAMAIEYHDPEAPWRVRFGIGRDSNPGTPESGASVFGLGFGWVNHALLYDAGVLHRGLQRGDSPTSSDDRVVGTVTYRFGGE